MKSIRSLKNKSLKIVPGRRAVFKNLFTFEVFLTKNNIYMMWQLKPQEEKDEMKKFLREELGIVLQRSNSGKILMFTNYQLDNKCLKKIFREFFGYMDYLKPEGYNSQYYYEITGRDLDNFKELFGYTDGDDDEIFNYL